MRADARRNLEKLLDAAIAMMLEVGPDAPLDSIARRAGVGIGTLYRRFPDRQSLINAVALYALDRSIDAGERALDETADGWSALRQYMHAGVDHGVGVLNLLFPMITDPHWSQRRVRSATILTRILESGREDGSIRSGVRLADIGFAIIRFSRPVAMGVDETVDRGLAHRHLDIYVDGLRDSALTLPDTHLLDAFEPDSRVSAEQLS